MSVSFHCPMCGKRIRAPEALAGQQRPCPQCRIPVKIPAQSEVPPPQANTVSAAPSTEHPLLIFGKRPVDDENLIDMTAMVDIVFFLLIFFLVTSMQALEAVIDLPMPDAPSSTAGAVNPAEDYTNDPNYIKVMIDGDDTVWVDEEEVYGEENLRAKLRALKREDPDRTGMLVVGDADANHGTFVMVLDAGADAGMKDLLFSARESVDESDSG